MNIRETEDLARRIRIDALGMIHAAGSGHPGGSLSAADLLAVLFTRELDWSSERHQDLDRNRFVLSKGHACPALYAAAADAGWVARKELEGFRRIDRMLQGHPHCRVTPWVETSTGSLGQGLSVALGMAMGIRHQGGRGRVYCMVGDGELQEGEVWEAANAAGHHRVGNLCVLVDYNKLQSDDRNENIMTLEPLADRWSSFGWWVREIDGHDFEAIADALDRARAEARPQVIIAHTLKGRGVAYMEDVPAWHGSVKLRDEDLERALRDLGVDDAGIRQYLEGVAWQN